MLYSVLKSLFSNFAGNDELKITEALSPKLL